MSTLDKVKQIAINSQCNKPFMQEIAGAWDADVDKLKRHIKTLEELKKTAYQRGKAEAQGREPYVALGSYYATHGTTYVANLNSAKVVVQCISLADAIKVRDEMNAEWRKANPAVYVLDFSDGIDDAKYPDPTCDEPDFDEYMAVKEDTGMCECTDGCEIETPQGLCKHGHQTWLRWWGAA